MKLIYYLSKNFGDALNPYIFNHFLSDFFDDKEDTAFVGIGSVLGFKEIKNSARKIIFSSGYAYGVAPQIDDTYDIMCVRGPLSAKVLKIDKKLAIADGAILIQYMHKSEVSNKRYDFSFMPHWESAMKFNWKELCGYLDINYINPMDETSTVLNEIVQSKVVIAEAMHGAIVADALRIPWIPVKAYGGINAFKWNDWTSSLALSYDPNTIDSLYHNTPFTREIIKEKSGYPLSADTLSPVVTMYEAYQRKFKIKPVIEQLKLIKSKEPFLSSDYMIKSKGEALLDKIELVKKKYQGY